MYTKISTKILEKTGTTIEKYVTHSAMNGKNYVKTVTHLGEGNRLRAKYGIDTIVDEQICCPNRALISGDTIVLSGSTKPENFRACGNFKELFKEMMETLKKNPVLEKKNYNPHVMHNNRIYNGAGGINIPG